MEDMRNEMAIWKKQLALLENNNIAMKTRLAHILRYHSDRRHLETLEYFHNTFLQQDSRFEALRNEMALQHNWLSVQRTDHIHIINLQKHQQQMRHKLEAMEKDVQQSMQAFGNYLLQHFPALP